MDHRAVIQQSLNYIEDNLKTEITASELADRAGFSIYHYYRVFQAATGMPVMQYILRRRLLHGAWAISRGSTGVRAALDYGFDTYAGFYRAFVRELGCTPSEYIASGRAKKPRRIDLMKEEHIMITKKKAAEMLKYWNLEGEDVTDVYFEGIGNRNENAYYVGSGYVLKCTANLGKLTTHGALSRAIADVGLQAASLVPTAEGREYVPDGEVYFYLTRRLDGKQIDPGELLAGNSGEKARFVGEIIGQLHLALSRVEGCVNDADLLETVKGWALPRAKEAMDLDSRFCGEFLEAFGELYPSLPRQIIHRDPNPGNIICSGEAWGFIDFELSERNARIYDPCYAATAVLSEIFLKADAQTLDRWVSLYRNILAGYDSVVKLTEEERRAAPYVLLANQFVCVAWFAGEEKYGELFEVNKRMTRWLMACFDDLRME